MNVDPVVIAGVALGVVGFTVLGIFYVRRNPPPAPERNGAAYLWSQRPTGMSMDGSDSESNRPSDASESNRPSDASESNRPSDASEYLSLIHI